jgi:hypothetical protein
MSAQDFKPWWDRVNEYLAFDELSEFQRGAGGYRPNNRQEALVAMLSAGYVRKQTFEQPKSHTGKK